MDRQLTELATRLLARSTGVEGSTAQRNLNQEMDLLGSLESFARGSLAHLLEAPKPEGAAVAPAGPATSGVGGTPARSGAEALPSAAKAAGGRAAAMSAGARTSRAAAAAAAAAEAARRPGYGTHREEYRPALSNPGVVNALLELSRQRPATLRSGRAAASVDAERFRQADLPAIAAQPKEERPLRKAPGIYQPILRSPADEAKKGR